jgi:GntR family transcriptional regulator / MocR family aminotransferase
MDSDWTSGRDLLLRLDSGRGLRAGIEQSLREAMRDGRLLPGVALPSSRSLARDLGVARDTVSAAYSQLAAEGYLAIRQGAPVRAIWQPQYRPTPVASPAQAACSGWDLRPCLPESGSFPRQA